MRKHLLVAALTFGLALGACSEHGNVTGLVPAGTVSATSKGVGPALAQAERLARAVALAMAKPQIRAQIRNAMRDSRFTDHKLVLQDYVQQREGSELVAHAASALGTTPAALLATIAALPRLDFYVPFREHRLAWRGSPEVQVAAVFDGDAPTIRAFGRDGAGHTLHLADGLPPRALIVLHPEEPKGVRPASELTGTGDVIQRDDESRVLDNVRMPISGSPRDQLLSSLTESCGDFVFFCDGGPGSGAGPAPGVYITQFDSHRGDGWFGSLEIQWQSYGFSGRPEWVQDPSTGRFFWNYPGDECPLGTAKRTIEGRNYTGELVLLSPGITDVNFVACGRYELRIVEIDGGLNGNNDDFGRRFFIPTLPPGGLPFDAQVGRPQDYYSNSGSSTNRIGTPSDQLSERSMTVTLEYRR